MNTIFKVYKRQADTYTCLQFSLHINMYKDEFGLYIPTVNYEAFPFSYK